VYLCHPDGSAGVCNSVMANNAFKWTAGEEEDTPKPSADDDFVPDDIFASGSAATKSESPAVGLTSDDADYIPEDFFSPVAQVESTSLLPVEEPFPASVPDPEPVSTIAELQAEPESFLETEPEPEPEPIATLTELQPKTIATLKLEPITEDPEYPAEEPPPAKAPVFKPFPVAPPLPPLPLPSTTASLSDAKPPVQKPVAATPPRQAALPTNTPMIRTTSRKDPPRTAISLPSPLDGLLRLAASLGASRLYLSANTPPSVRVAGVIAPLMNSLVLGPTEIETLLVSLALATQGGSRASLTATHWSFDLPDVGNVRCTTFKDSRGPGAVFRIVSTDRVVEEPVGLSLDIQTLTVEPDGLVIVAGPRGSDKHTVIRALVDLVSRTRKAYVINVQREPGVPATGEGSFVSQREARGLDEILDVARAALQEDPDVLVLEEVRSAPLMNLAFNAAASGQLIIAGFTAPSANAAIARIIDLFPTEDARQVQLSLAQSLRGVVGQVLVPKISGGHIAARELLLNTAAVSSVLAAGKIEHLSAAIAAGRQQGMVTLGDALLDLVHNRVVSAADAYRQAPDPVAFIDELKRLGVDTSFVKQID
jgi:twitching motility protein PilT